MRRRRRQSRKLDLFHCLSRRFILGSWVWVGDFTRTFERICYEEIPSFSKKIMLVIVCTQQKIWLSTKQAHWWLQLKGTRHLIYFFEKENYFTGMTSAIDCFIEPQKEGWVRTHFLTCSTNVTPALLSKWIATKDARRVSVDWMDYVTSTHLMTSTHKWKKRLRKNNIPCPRSCETKYVMNKKHSC